MKLVSGNLSQDNQNDPNNYSDSKAALSSCLAASKYHPAYPASNEECNGTRDKDICK